MGQISVGLLDLNHPLGKKARRRCLALLSLSNLFHDEKK